MLLFNLLYSISLTSLVSSLECLFLRNGKYLHQNFNTDFLRLFVGLRFLRLFVGLRFSAFVCRITFFCVCL